MAEKQARKSSMAHSPVPQTNRKPTPTSLNGSELIDAAYKMHHHAPPSMAPNLPRTAHAPPVAHTPSRTNGVLYYGRISETWGCGRQEMCKMGRRRLSDQPVQRDRVRGERVRECDARGCSCCLMRTFAVLWMAFQDVQILPG